MLGHLVLSLKTFLLRTQHTSGPSTEAGYRLLFVFWVHTPLYWTLAQIRSGIVALCGSDNLFNTFPELVVGLGGRLEEFFSMYVLNRREGKVCRFQL